MNKTIMAIAMAFGLAIGGCSFITLQLGSEEELFIIEKPEKPTTDLPELDSELNDRERALVRAAIGWKRYSEKLEVSIDEYNKYAKEKNNE